MDTHVWLLLLHQHIPLLIYQDKIGLNSDVSFWCERVSDCMLIISLRLWCLERASEADRKCHCVYMCVCLRFIIAKRVMRKEVNVWTQRPGDESIHRDHTSFFSLSGNRHTSTCDQYNTDGSQRRCFSVLVMSYRVWLSLWDFIFKSSGSIWVQEDYFTGAAHSRK